MVVRAMRIKIILSVALVLVCAATYFVGSINWTERGQAATAPTAAVATVAPDSSAPNPSTSGSSASTNSANLATPDRFTLRRPMRPDVVPVVVAPVKKSEVPIYLSGIGTVLAYNTVEVKSQVDGVIKGVNFQEGQDVKIGDPLVLIDPQIYEAKLEEAKGLKAKAQALLENAKSNLWRDKQLLAKDFATQKQTDEQTALVGQYTAEIAQYDGQIKYAQAQLDFATIRSPINGRTGIRKVDPGNLIRSADNTNIVTITQLQPIYVIITVPAKELESYSISPGLSTLAALAYAENGVTLLGRGQVQTINNMVNTPTGTVNLKAAFANEQYKLWPGDFVDCKIIVEKRRDGLSVPTAAVRHGPKGDYAWVVLPDSTVEMRRIKVKQTVGDRTVIDLGLQADEKVVTEGYYFLQVGSHVEVVTKGTGDKSEVSSAK
jgi:membrane fusion protein, multidrug efflux system